MYKDNRGKTARFRVSPTFVIHLDKKDLNLLTDIREFFGTGVINMASNDTAVRFDIRNLESINSVIIPHFTKYPLKTQKLADFLLFKTAVELVNKGDHLTEEGLNKIMAIKASMNNGLTPNLIQSFPNIVSVARPLVKEIKTIEPEWFVGFTDAEGCFDVTIAKSKAKLGYSVQIRFRIHLHYRDYSVIEGLKEYLKCGYITVNSSKSKVNITITSITDIINTLKPIFNQFPVQGAKNKDYLDFCRVAELIENKAHLTPTGLAKIKAIKDGMNTKRD